MRTRESRPLTRRRPRRGPSSSRPRFATGQPTSRSRGSARGARRSRSSTARSAAPCRCRGAAAGAAAAGHAPDGRRQPAGRAGGVRQHHLPTLRRSRPARDRHARLPLRRALAVDPGLRARRGARAAPSRRSWRSRTCATGCPPSAWSPARTAATSCSTSASSPRRCATSGRSSSSPTASRSPAACSTRW